MSEMERAKHMKKGGQVKKKKKKQGYKDRKDESIAMRVKKKRTKKQLKASRDESYGKWGSAAKYLITEGYCVEYYGQSNEEIKETHLSNRKLLYERGLIS